MPEHLAEQPLTDPVRKLPALPEEPDISEPPRAESLEGDARVSLEPVPIISTAKLERQGPSRLEPRVHRSDRRHGLGQEHLRCSVGPAARLDISRWQCLPERGEHREDAVQTAAHRR